jgi:hypothetical protein
MLCYSWPFDEDCSSFLLHWMSKDADINLIDNANALELFFNSSFDDTLFPNLISITEIMSTLYLYCSPKPIILLNEGRDYLSDLNKAIGVLIDRQEDYLIGLVIIKELNMGGY